MEKILQLFERCKAEVIITHNGHRGVYETVEEYIMTWGGEGERERVADEVFAEMMKRDTVIEVQFYPHTPGGFGLVFHYDLAQAVDQALAEIALD